MTACAPAETLEQLLAGELTDAEAAPLRVHVVDCPHCQGALDRLSDNPELRGWADDADRLGLTVGEAADLERVLQSLRETRTLTPSLRTSDEALAASLSFLGPPEQEGDLGTLGPYRVLAEVGRGGMGVVLKGFDKSLARLVALKVLRWERADDRARARFVREARAAAALNHDHVVPVHSVVNLPNAPPFLVMPLIDGPTLRERLLAEQRLDPRKAATICLQVADGLAAAHAAGLIHRDIKPANIILDAVNQRARIMDFGLVRVKEQAGGATQEGTIAGTPEYMSPEQIRTPDRIDERSDVYSLGVTLYEMLTGAVPFRGATPMVLQQVLHDEAIAPRRLSDQAPRDLETICQKAMAKEPGRRYPSALALRRDLERFLAGEPIQARPVGRPERLWRWCRRRPALASMAAALLLVVAGGFGGVTWQWLRADRNHDLAEARRKKAHQAIHDYFTLVSENKLLGKPGLQELRKDLLDSALGYYQEFLREWGDDPAMQTEVAATYVRVAAMQDQIGNPGDAKAAYRQAVGLYKKLAQTTPADAELQAARARASARLGDLLARTDDLDDAFAVLSQARALQEKLVEDDHANLTRQSELAKTLVQIGVLMDKQGRRADARRAFEQALTAWRRLVDVAPDRPEFRSELAATFSAVSNLAYTAQDWDEALHYLEEAHAHFERLVAESPNVADYQAGLADCLRRLSSVYNRLAFLDKAIAASTQARDIRERLVDKNPSVTEFQFQLALAYEYLAKDLGQRPATLPEALATCEQALPLYTKLLRIAPGHPDYRQRLADLHINRGHYLSKLDRPADALPCFEQSRAILEELVREFPRTAEYQHVLGVACHNHGNELLQVGRRDEARQAFKRSDELYVELIAKDSESLFYQEMQARVFLRLAGMHSADNEHAPAARLAEQALQICRKLHALKPDTPRYEQLVAMGCTGVGQAARAAGRPSDAESYFREVVAIREKFVDVQPPVTDAHLDAARAYRDLAELKRQQKPAEALALYECCRDRSEQALAANPLSIQAQSVFGQAWDGVGICRAQLGQAADALRAHEAAAKHHHHVFSKSPKQTAYRECLSEHYAHVARLHRDQGRTAEAARATLERKKLWLDNSAELYRVACDLAACSKLVAAGKTPPTASQQKEQTWLADEAIAALAEAIRNGHADWKQIENEPSFASLRSRPDFQQLLAAAPASRKP